MDLTSALPDAGEQCQRCQNLVLAWTDLPFFLEDVQNQKYIKNLGTPSTWNFECKLCWNFLSCVQYDFYDEEDYFLVPASQDVDSHPCPPSESLRKAWRLERKSLLEMEIGEERVFRPSPLDGTFPKEKSIGIFECTASDSSPFATYDNLRYWIDCCLNDPNHYSCRNSLAPRPRKLHVIDCQRRVVIPLPTGKPYLALSYVWGKITKVPQCNNGHGEDEPSASNELIPESDLPDDLPQLITDCLAVVLGLGYQYLWIDRYCISQADHSGEKSAQIAQMDLVYIGAVATIIAAEGQSPNDGLHGVSIPQTPVEKTFIIGRTKHFLFNNLISARRSDLSKRKYGTRAWTYQECVLSRRRIVFFDGHVHLECHTGPADSSCRALKAPIIFDRLETLPQSEESVSDSLWRHVVAYANRTLSFPEDVLKAITGILEYYSRISPGFYTISGLPIEEAQAESFLEGLVWVGGNCRRREGFPSWSWLGYEGKIHRHSGPFFDIYPCDMCAEFQVILADGSRATPLVLVEAMSTSGTHHALVHQLVATGFSVHCHFDHQIDPHDGRSSWNVQLPNSPFRIFPKSFRGDLFVDKRTGKNFTTLLLWLNRLRNDSRDCMFALLILEPCDTENGMVWERVGLLHITPTLPESWLPITPERLLKRLEDLGCVSRQEIILV
jgi:hypothetical protein